MAVSAHEEPGSSHWHLCWQAAIGRELFVDDDMYARVRERIIDAHRRKGRALVDYALFPREFHVMSRLAPGDTPGLVARAIGNIVGRWVRRAHPVRSPVFAGPFQARPIATDDDMRYATRMLAWRPVVLGLCRAPSHYPHAALRTTLGLRPAQGFDARPILQLFGTNVPLARAALRRWLARRPSGTDVMQWELLCGLSLASDPVDRGPSSRAVRDEATAALLAAGGCSVAGALNLLHAWAQLKARGVGGGIGVGLSDRSSGARARALAACLAVDHGVCSAATVARHFGRAKATLSEQMASCRRRAQDRTILTRGWAEIAAEAVAIAHATDLGGRAQK